MIPNYTFDNCPPPDIFVIPGGAAQNVTRDSLAMEFVKSMCDHADIVLTVCSGSFILARAGLLDGLTATAHQDDLEDLRRFAPKTKVVSARYVDNGKIITAGGVSSGIDGALHIIERMHGKERADAIAYYLQHARRLP